MKRHDAKIPARLGPCEPVEIEQRSMLLAKSTKTTFRMAQATLIVALTAFVVAISGSGFAAGPGPNGSTKSLDEQVQEIKSDVLSIASELNNLEERLLYPSNTQIAVFVSVAEGRSIDLDSARISIDGNLVSQHIYSFKELEALEKGGVQRIYTGNVKVGEHRLDVAISRSQNSDKSVETIESFVFEKDVDPKLVGVTLGSSPTGSATIAIKDW